MNEVSKDLRSEEPRLSTAELAARRPAAEAAAQGPPSIAPAGSGRDIPVVRSEEAAPGDERPRELPDGGEDHGPLFPEEEAGSLRREWDAIQIAFVDEPRRCVERADELVARAIQRLAEGFAQERSRLESQWGRGEEVSTEDLRVALRRYRSFFGRLLAA